MSCRSRSYLRETSAQEEMTLPRDDPVSTDSPARDMLVTTDNDTTQSLKDT